MTDFRLFAILQKYDFPSKSQPVNKRSLKSKVVCDTAKVRFSKQITTNSYEYMEDEGCLRYCKSTIFQANHNKVDKEDFELLVVCDTAKVRFSKQITTQQTLTEYQKTLFAILQKYDFPSKSQPKVLPMKRQTSCLRYCKSTIIQANHNATSRMVFNRFVVCDTAKVRFSKQITTERRRHRHGRRLFAILQKYDFPSKSQPNCACMNVP